MTYLFITLVLVVLGGVAGFLAGVKHADKARAIKDTFKK